MKFEHFFVQTLYSKIYHIKNGSIGRLFVTLPLSEIVKKIGKMLKYTPTLKVAPLIVDIRTMFFVG